MSKKRKSNAPENEHYEIVIDDWEIKYHFGKNTIKNDIFTEEFWEDSHLILVGKIVSPILKHAIKANVVIMENPKLDDHWTNKSTVRSATAIGFMEIPKDENILYLNCWVPSRSFHLIPIAVASGKINHASIFGTKLKWRKGEIFSITLSMKGEHE